MGDSGLPAIKRPLTRILLSAADRPLLPVALDYPYVSNTDKELTLIKSGSRASVSLGNERILVTRSRHAPIGNRHMD